MDDGLSALGWLVVVCAGALGFGLVRFLIVAAQEPKPGPPADGSETPAAPPGEPPR